MASPAELSRLGARARFQKLGSLKYIVASTLILLICAAIEVPRYEQYHQCINTESTRIVQEATARVTKELSNSLSALAHQPNRQAIEDLAKQLEQISKEIEEYKPKSDNDVVDLRSMQFLMLQMQKQSLQMQKTSMESATVKCHTSYRYDVFLWLSSINPISPAYAQVKLERYSENEIRGMVIMSIFACMGLYFFISTGALLFSKNAKVVAF